MAPFPSTTPLTSPFICNRAVCLCLPRPQLDGEKVVSRSRGFTVDTCVSAVDEEMESPEFQGLPPGDKVKLPGMARQRMGVWPVSVMGV